MFKTKKKLNVQGIVYALMLMMVVSLYAVPVLASNINYPFSFSFEGINAEQKTECQYKHTDHAITMTCTGSDNLSPYIYYATAYSDDSNDAPTSTYSMYTGKTCIFYYVDRFINDGVYIEGYLSGDDVDAFWGTWNPDDARY